MVLGRVGSRGVWSVSCKMTWRLIHAALVLIANFKLIHYPQIGGDAICHFGGASVPVPQCGINSLAPPK